MFFLASQSFFISCKKEEAPKDCAPNGTYLRSLLNQKATIKENNSLFYRIEEGTIDTRLIPCNLEREFQVNNLQVRVSGDVKATFSTGP